MKILNILVTIIVIFIIVYCVNLPFTFLTSYLCSFYYYGTETITLEEALYAHKVKVIFYILLTYLIAFILVFTLKLYKKGEELIGVKLFHLLLLLIVSVISIINTFVVLHNESVFSLMPITIIFQCSTLTIVYLISIKLLFMIDNFQESNKPQA